MIGLLLRYSDTFGIDSDGAYHPCWTGDSDCSWVVP